MVTYQTIEVDERDGFAEVTLNRPDVLNALDEQMATELRDAFREIREQRGVRAVLLKGAGRAFCAGGDVRVMEGSVDDNPAAFFEVPLERIHEAARELAELPLPVVGAIHGFASGAGFNLALCCDLLVSSAEARFNQAFVRIGAVPDTGGTFWLPRLVGAARARELFLLGELIDAKQALTMGIVNRVVPAESLLTEARALAAKLATGPTQTYAEIKSLVLRSAGSTLSEALDAEREAQLRNAATADFKEGVTAFVQKRPARYQGR